jgi:hypothetical protein
MEPDIARTPFRPGSVHIGEIFFSNKMVKLRGFCEGMLSDTLPSEEKDDGFKVSHYIKGSFLSNSLSEPVIKAQILVDQVTSHSIILQKLL